MGLLNKKGKTDTGMLIVIGIIAIALFAPGTFDNLLGGLGGGSDDGDGTINVCSSSTTPQLTMQPVRQYQENNTVSATYVLWVDGAQSSDTSSPLDVIVGKPYTLYATATNYYGTVIEGTAACEENQVLAPRMNRVATNTSIGYTFFNADGTASTAQAIAAAEEKTVKLKLTATNDEVWNNPECGKDMIMCFNYTTSHIDFVEVIGGSAASIPRDQVGVALNSPKECWTLPGTADGLTDLEEYEARIIVNADDATNPTGNIAVFIYDWDWYRAKGTGELTCGVNDDDDNDLGIGYVVTNGLDMS